MAKRKRKVFRRTSQIKPNVIYRFYQRSGFIYLVPFAVDENKPSFVPLRVQNHFKHIFGGKSDVEWGYFPIAYVWNEEKKKKVYHKAWSFQAENTPQMRKEFKSWHEAGERYLEEVKKDQDKLHYEMMIEKGNKFVINQLNQIWKLARGLNAPIAFSENFEAECAKYEREFKDFIRNYMRQAGLQI